MTNFEFWVDGSCRGNGNPEAEGSYGVVALGPDKKIAFTRYHAEKGTTNNRQEMKAILWVMLNFGVNKKRDAATPIPTVYSDSAYAVNAYNNWMFAWEIRGWLKSNNKPPENLDLVQAYYDWYERGYRINLELVKGHNNIKGNELADELATTGTIKEL